MWLRARKRQHRVVHIGGVLRVVTLHGGRLASKTFALSPPPPPTLSSPLPFLRALVARLRLPTRWCVAP